MYSYYELHDLWTSIQVSIESQLGRRWMFQAPGKAVVEKEAFRPQAPSQSPLTIPPLLLATSIRGFITAIDRSLPARVCDRMVRTTTS